MSKPWSEAEKQMLRDVYPQAGAKPIHEATGRGLHAIRQQARTMGLTAPWQGRPTGPTTQGRATGIMTAEVNRELARRERTGVTALWAGLLR